MSIPKFKIDDRVIILDTKKIGVVIAIENWGYLLFGAIKYHVVIKENGKKIILDNLLEEEIMIARELGKVND